MILEVNKFNAMQDKAIKEYINKCKSNGVDPLYNRIDDYFPKFNYKQGYVLDGKYPRYNKLKRNLTY